MLFSLVLVPILFQGAFAQKTAHEILQEHGNYLVTHTKMEYNGAILVVTQTINKLEYRIGENITVQCALVNIGNNAVTINHLVPLLQTSVTHPNGTAYFPIHYPTILIGGDETIGPDNAIAESDCRTTADNYPTPVLPVKIDIPGTYIITSFAYFTIHDNRSPVSFEPLWSKPIQIIVLPQNNLQNESISHMSKIPEFPFVSIMLAFGIVSVVVIYRIRK